MTPAHLASELDVPEEEVRRILRSLGSGGEPGVGGNDELSPEVADRVRQHLAGGTSGAGSVT
jgi:hypothetical protein